MSATPGAMHLRTLSTISDISSDQSNTIIFALPVEILKSFEGKSLSEGKVESIVKSINKKK